MVGVHPKRVRASRFGSVAELIEDGLTLVLSASFRESWLYVALPTTMRYMVEVSSREGGRESLLLRGTLDMCVLGLLSGSPTHAYGIVQALQARGFPEVGYGTVYPLVTRLRRQGLLSHKSRPGSGGPAKNVLTVTAEGEEALAAWLQQWWSHNKRVDTLLGYTSVPTPTKGQADVD